MPWTLSFINKSGRAIFYMHQTRGECTALCPCDGMYQMNKSR